MSTKPLDIVLFGASGFTGKFCIKEIHRQIKTGGHLLTWGIAGRSENKLKTVLLECQKETGEDFSNVPIIIANVENYQSLKQMTAQAKIIINCCGPYRLYGEPVVKACIETGTHQVDVTGEPAYMELIQLKYHKAAQDKGIYIVSSCGFDSVPGDLGVLFLQKNFKGVLNSVETYIHLEEEIKKGPTFNYATWVSAIHGFASGKELAQNRRKLFPNPLPKLQPRLKPKPKIHKSDVISGWGIPFFGADRSVIHRTQRYLYENENVRPVQVQCYEVADSLYRLIGVVFYGSLIQFLAKYKYGQKLLIEYPDLFTAGMFSYHQAPPEEKQDKTKVTLTFRGEGWDEKTEKIGTEFKEPPNKTVVSYISGYSPAYKMTAKIVMLAATTIINETDNLPKNGGVYTPGAAFAKTSLLEQLRLNGLVYQMKSKL